MEKQLAIAGYWLGVISTVLALVTRLLAMIGVVIFPLPAAGKIPISYRSFLDGAMLFFVLAIASSLMKWARSQS
ncbi:MAG TPA: hypothetical protein VJR23_09280 [Candidatus Acidoferrales bacterium]|nr:hypothetical protein [Candidatus Acidoferrales bacterium]